MNALPSTHPYLPCQTRKEGTERRSEHPHASSPSNNGTRQPGARHRHGRRRGCRSRASVASAEVKAVCGGARQGAHTRLETAASFAGEAVTCLPGSRDDD